MGNKNKLFLAILSTFVIFSGMMSTTTDITVKGDMQDTIVVECDFPLPIIEPVKIENECYDRITMGILPNSCDMDISRLPIKPLKVLLPFGRMLDSITVVVKNRKSMGNGFYVEKGQKIIPLASNEMIDNGFNGFDVSDRLFTIVGTYVWRGYTILFVNLHPVQYITDSGEIIWYDHITLQVKTQPTSVIKSVRNMNQDKELVIKEIVNPQVFKTYEDAPCSAPLDSVEYVIITNEELKDATGTYTFQDLVTAK